MLSGINLDGYLDSVKTMVKNAKNSLLNIPEMEAKVLEATSGENWGASSTQMREIARATHSYANFPIIMSTIWRRLDEENKNWRHILKALILLEFLMKNGSEQVIRESRVHVMELQRLQEFSFIENDKDYGQSVRDKAKALHEFLHDDDRIHEEREKARVTAAKFSESISSDNYYSRGGGYGNSGGGGGYGGNSGGYGGNSGGGYGRDYDSDYKPRSRESDRYSDRDRNNRDYDDDSYRRSNNRDYDREEPPRTATRHIRAPSGGSPVPEPKKAAAPAVNFFELDEPAKPAAASTDFFAAFPASNNAPAPAPVAAPATIDFFASTPAPSNGAQSNGNAQQQTKEDTEWAEFAKADAPTDSTMWGAHKKLFNLDNLATPSNAAQSQAKKPLGGSLGTPVRPLGQPTVTPTPALGGGVPLGRGAPLGAGQPLGVGVQQYGVQPMGVQPMGMQPYGVQPMGVQPMGMGVQPMGVPVGYAPGLVPAGYGVAPVGYAPGVVPAGYGVAPIGYAPGVRPPTAGYPVTRP